MVQQYTPVPNQGGLGTMTKPEKGNGNKVDTYYHNIAMVAIVVVIVAIVLMALAAAIIAKDLNEIRGIAAAVNLGVGVFHIFFFLALFTPLYKPKARNTPTPRTAFVNVLLFSVLIWIPACVLMFLAYGGGDGGSSSGYERLIKRKGGGGGKGGGFKIGEAIKSGNIFIGCGVLGACGFLLSLWQLWAVYRLHSVQFDPVDIEMSACLRQRRGRPKY
ncbi:hypothetical protein FQN50_006767 [Emmonsiellopsis sp. PD_5]|nr:hypothetical protein FQN50_006767 [Emmonsiellopsis sp. PD_5]